MFRKIKSRHLVSIVIPVYKETISEFERIALQRCNKILSAYPAQFVAPESLDMQAYTKELPDASIIRFPEKYFKDTYTYSKLLTIPRFYKAFTGSEYILIYQLDAYVFKDNLEYWCKSGYDYIGAPWVNEDWIHQLKKDIRINFSSKWIRKVGNGGLSLRKVKSSLKASRYLYFLALIWWKNEDVFWSNVVPRLFPYKIPSVQTALKFSFDLDPERCYELNDRQLPFGCHAWDKNYSFWKTFIPAG